MLALFLMFQATPPEALNLTCIGGGTANKITSTNIYGSQEMHGSIGGAPVSAYGDSSATITGSRQQGFADQVDVRLFAGDDRIRMPRTMLPPIHGGSGGWFRLKGVQADARSIRASVVINFMNNPKVLIDRVTGTISISGKAGDFSGQCQAIDANAPAKF